MGVRVLEREFTVSDVARTRFALSPLWEVVAGVRVLKSPGEHPLHRPWIEQARRRLAGLDLRLLSDLVPALTRVIPGLVCPRHVSGAVSGVRSRAERLVLLGVVACGRAGAEVSKDAVEFGAELGVELRALVADAVPPFLEHELHQPGEQVS